VTVRTIPILYEEDIAALISPREAAEAIRDALLGGLEPALDRPREVVDVASGQLLLMPSESATGVGVKAVTVAPGNAALGLPRVHGAYLLYDARTLELRCIMDGACLSTLRTPAVSMAGARPAFGRFDRRVTVTVFGGGPQAAGHAQALATGGFAEVGDLAFVVRNAERARRDLGPGATVLAASDPALKSRLRDSDVIVCTTTSRQPLFPADAVPDRAVVIVVGAHEPTWREVEGALLARSTVVVEDVETALREAGDIVLAIAEGSYRPGDMLPMAAMIRGDVQPDPDRPYVFKSVGMSWEDLVVAEAILGKSLGGLPARA
jgi:ornithine cyclodeaminase/alanine dehydrogenase-like protein (mu-crystallin family)